MLHDSASRCELQRRDLTHPQRAQLATVQLDVWRRCRGFAGRRAIVIHDEPNRGWQQTLTITNRDR